MRSGLCLRIPTSHELSPAHNASKSSLHSMSFNKPSSPKPSETKNHQRTPTQSSAYSRITSNLSLKKLSLPSFLRISPKETEEVLNKLPLGKSVVHQSSDCPTDTSSIKTNNEELNKGKNSQLAETPDSFISKIFEKGRQKDEVLLKVGKIELTRGELQSLQPKNQVSRNVIEACLRCIKHKNRKFFKSAESHDRVLIINTNFSQHIFNVNKELKMHCQRNPLKYEYVLFPVFIGFWTLLSLDNRRKKLQIYGISENDVLIEQIFDCVKEFIRKELKFHENKEVECTGWRELGYEILNYGEIDDVDSGAFAIRVAYKIAINSKASLNNEVLSDFRYNLIVMLFKHGNQICH